MNKAWIALSLAPAVVMLGCKSEPEPVAQVPPPNYAAEPEPLPPVSINEGTTIGAVGEPAGPTTARIVGQPGGFEPEPLPPTPPARRTYTIRKGDTLWAIAQREYGNGQRWVDISQANQSIDNPKNLKIGQQIILP